MVLFNHATKEVTAKLVYYGPGLCGKTTNLQWVHENVTFKSKGKMLSLATEADRTLFFDFLPVELGTIRGHRTRVQMYTVPGQVFYDITRRMVLKGADAIVFVVDSQEAMLDANLESLESLRRNLIANELDPALPMVFQYNKRDLPTALPVSVLNARINVRNLPSFEAIAVKGVGVEDTLKGVTKLLFRKLADFYGTEASPVAPPTRASEEAKASTSAPPPAPVGQTVTPAPAPPVARPAAVTPAPPPPAQKPPPAPTAVAPAPAATGLDPRPVVPRPSAPTVAPKPAAEAPAPHRPPPVSVPAPAVAKPVEKAEAPKPIPAATPERPAAKAPEAARATEPPATSAASAASAAFAAATASAATVASTLAPSSATNAAPESPPAERPEVPETRRRRSEDASRPNPEGVGEGQWLYLLDKHQRGPLDLDDLIDLVLTALSEDTKVWRPGMRDWLAAKMVPEIAEQIPPPLPFTGAGEEDFPDFNTVPEALRTALIADEDEGFRKLLALPLAAQGFRIFEAADGVEAWRLATENRPWMMLADLDLPEIDGFEFCRRVRANTLLSHTPFVFISSSDKFKDRARAQQVGSDDFLSKQTPIRELLIRIQLLLNRYSSLSGKQGQPGGGAVSGLLEGQLEVFGAPGVLQICNQSGLTGIFTARVKEPDSSAEKVAVMGFREGEIINATVCDQSGTDAVYAFLAWPQGHFKFVPGDPGSGEPLAQSVEHLLLEGCRLLDEAGRGTEGELAPV